MLHYIVVYINSHTSVIFSSSILGHNKAKTVDIHVKTPVFRKHPVSKQTSKLTQRKLMCYKEEKIIGHNF